MWRNGTWDESKIVCETSDSTPYVREQRDVDLYKKYGGSVAIKLHEEKKLKQQQNGDRSEGYPHWFKHPDLPEDPAR